MFRSRAMLSLLALPAVLAGQANRLELGKVIRNELAPGQSHSYLLALRAGQYMHIAVSDPGLTTVLRLLAPDGKEKLVELHLPGEAQRREPLCWVAEASGEYHVELAASGPAAPARKYEMTLAELRAAAPDDQKRITAQSLFEKARALTDKRGFREAIGVWEQALGLVREVKDRERESEALGTIGLTYYRLSQNEKAIGYYELALALRRELRDRRGEDVVLNHLGNAYLDLSRYEKAAGYYEQALAIAREIGDRNGEATALNNLGESWLSLSRYETAIGYYEQALGMAREIKDRQGEGTIRSNLGNAWRSLGRYEMAIGYYEQALAIDREVKDRRAEGTALNNLGTAYNNLSQYEKAIGYYEQALAIDREVKDRAGEDMALNNLGAVYSNLSQYEKAIGYYEQALAIFREVKDRAGEGLTLNNLGVAYGRLSQYAKAIGYYEQALGITRAIKNRQGEGSVLHSLGEAHRKLSQYEKAIGYFEQALAVRREVKDRRGEGDTLNSLGVVHNSLGQYEKGIGYCEQALGVRREIKDRDGEGNTLNSLGVAYYDLGRYERAIGYYEQALEIQREVKDRDGEGHTLNNLGVAAYKLKQYEKAIGYEEQALAFFREVKDRDGEGFTLDNLGAVYRNLGQYEKSIGHFDQALAILHEVGDRQSEGATLVGLMLAWQGAGKPLLAIFYGKQAVNTVQSMRSGMRGLGQELRQSFLKTNEGPYHTLADLLISRGRLAEAEQVLNLLKQEEYVEFLRLEDSQAAGASRPTDLTAGEAESDQRYRDIGERLVAIGAERRELLAKRTLTPEEKQRMTRLGQDLAAANTVFERFLDELPQHFSAQPGASASRVREDLGIMADLRDLPAGTVAIYTLAGDDKYRAILVTPDVRKAYEYPISAADLNRKVFAFREVVQNPKLDPRPLAQDLYRILIAGMAEDLRQAKAQTLMWALDGSLRYLPVAALFDGKNYLIEKYRVSVFTPASNARLKGSPDRKWRAAGFGVTKEHEGAAALPSVASELTGIIAQRQGRGVLDGEIKLDEQFTEEAMRDTLLKGYTVVHIASHFRFEPANEAKSFLLLGDGNHLSLAKLKVWPNLFEGVQLLTLSACNTALGDGEGDGKEVEGFGVLAQRQGAKAVIASLWAVADASTSLLMRHLYRTRESSAGITKLEALRQAQLALLKGTVKAGEGAAADRALMHEAAGERAPADAAKFPLNPKTPYAHPYYWAPFFLMGNWL